MDCGNYSIEQILNDKGISVDYDQESIFSENYPEVSLLPKIGKVLLKAFSNVIIIHENMELFINIENEDEESIADEYREELYNFMGKGGKFLCNPISLELIDDFTSNKFYCIIPIRKDEKSSHFVVLKKENEEWKILDNKKGEYSVNDEELTNMIEIYNGKYVLFCGESLGKTIRIGNYK